MTPLGVATALTATAAACVAYGALIERHWYRLRTITIPGALRGPGVLRILHLSDIHLVPSQRRRVAFLASLAELDHDLVVVTGDLLGAHDAEDAAADALAPLTSGGRQGLVVLGSNDFYGPVPKSPFTYFRDEGSRHGHLSDPARRLNTPRLIAALERHGYRTLRNSAGTFGTPTGTIMAGGIDDPHMAETVLPEADAVRTAEDGVLRLGIVHAPYRAALDVLVDAGHDVLLAGHTHGGQVRFPPIGALVGNCDLPLSQIRGLSNYRGRWLHVSPGLGHSRYAPFRFACRPEATLLEVTGA